jgi:subtilisin family serine protease
VTPTVSGSVTKPAASWGLDRTDQRSLPLDERITRGGTGAGVSAYVIDTGVYSASVEFGDRVASGFTAFSDGNGSNDCHGHGTHVAGTVGGSTYGFATEATIIPVRVLDCNGSGSTAGIVAGINWIIEHHVAGVPAVANMSLGTNSGIDVAINDAVARGVADGITFVVAAGNSYSDACSFSPSSAASAITVGATGSSDYFADFSNRGSCVDILAPGVRIISAAITSPTSYSMMSGTSMAAPHVAGVVANMLGNAPTMTPTQVATQLVATATKTTIAALPTGTTNALLYQQPASSNSFSLATEVDSSAVASDITANDSSVVTYEEDPGVPEPPTTTVPSTTVPATTVPPATVPPATVPPATVPPTVDATPTPSPVEPIAPAKPTPAVPTASPAQPTREVPVEAVAATEPPAPTTSSPVTSVLSAPLFTSAMTKISIGKITKVGKQLRVTVNAPKGSKVSLYRNGKLVGKGVKKVFMVPVSKVKKQNFTAVISIAGAFVSSASVSLPVRSASVR